MNISKSFNQQPPCSRFKKRLDTFNDIDMEAQEALAEQQVRVVNMQIL